MGGEPDGDGCVDAKKLIDTIKNEFQMTIDIEKLIEEIDEDGSGEIEFDEFKALLSSDWYAISNTLIQETNKDSQQQIFEVILLYLGL